MTYPVNQRGNAMACPVNQRGHAVACPVNQRGHAVACPYLRILLVQRSEKNKINPFDVYY
jgi:hypothetical protein